MDERERFEAIVAAKAFHEFMRKYQLLAMCSQWSERARIAEQEKEEKK